MAEVINWLAETDKVVEKPKRKKTVKTATTKTYTGNTGYEYEQIVAKVREQLREELKAEQLSTTLKFDAFKQIGQERVDEKNRKDREITEKGNALSEKSKKEEDISAKLLLDSTTLKDAIKANVGKYNVQVTFHETNDKSEHNKITTSYYSKDVISMYLYEYCWLSEIGVYRISDVAEKVAAQLNANGFKVTKVERDDLDRNKRYFFKIDLTSMYKEKN